MGTVEEQKPSAASNPARDQPLLSMHHRQKRKWNGMVLASLGPQNAAFMQMKLFSWCLSSATGFSLSYVTFQIIVELWQIKEIIFFGKSCAHRQRDNE